MTLEHIGMKQKEGDRWAGYNRMNAGELPRDLLVRAAELAKEHESALDVGAGSMRASRHLVTKFARVDAVDPSGEARELADGVRASNLTFVQSVMEQFEPVANTYDLVNAEYCLPFVGREHFAEVMRRLFASLKPGGIFTGQLFGLRDEWNVRGVSHRNGVQTVFLSTEDARHLFDGFDMIEFVEREYDAHKEDGSLKHMHIYDIIARKQ